LKIDLNVRSYQQLSVGERSVLKSKKKEKSEGEFLSQRENYLSVIKISCLNMNAKLTERAEEMKMPFHHAKAVELKYCWVLEPWREMCFDEELLGVYK
jgi:hypothetical protein